MEEIKNNQDWIKLKDAGFDTVIDPLVVRAGELFIRDLDEYENKEEAFNFLDKNIHGISTFIDTLILSKGIPIFNYNPSFREGFWFGEKIVQEINQEEEIIKEVDVNYEAYENVKESALKELENIYQGENKVSSDLANDILSELSDSQYSWAPSLGDSISTLNSENERWLAAFILGGIIFNGYAQKLGGDRIIQPKRSRLLLSVFLKDG